MTRDELEFLVSQYAEGDGALLTPAERDVVERQLATDPEARAMLADERRLSDLLAAETGDLAGDVDFSALSRRISTAVALAPLPEVAPAAPTAARARWLSPMRMALAASVLVAAGVAIPLLSRHGNTNTDVNVGGPVATNGATPIEIRKVDGLGTTADAPTDVAVAGPKTPSVVIAEVKPGPTAAQAVRTADAAIQRPSRVVIAPDTQPAQDTTPPTTPY